MDSFTQHMIEKAEQRNKALGLKNAINAPRPLSGEGMSTSAKLKTATTTTTPAKSKSLASPQRQQRSPSIAKSSNISKLQVIEKSPLEVSTSSGISSNSSSNKTLRQFSAIDKENMDLGIEISILSTKELEVRVEVEEQDITDNDESVEHAPDDEIVNQPLAKLRETSRNRLQRLGALYSNTDDLSSPIHRTEGQFHADSVDESHFEANAKKPKQRYGKLAALASSINEWEDDTSVHPTPPRSLIPPPKPDLPSRKLSTGNQAVKVKPASSVSSVNQISIVKTTSGTTTDGDKAKTKKLNWDPKVMDTLEAQGFQRRESSTVKLAYDYNKNPEETTGDMNGNGNVETKGNVGKVSKLVSSLAASTENKSTATAVTEKNPSGVPVRSGLVSGRAAVFEQKANLTQQPQRVQKDPTELTLKERMQLFERNKGEALIPKAALGMAPSIQQIRQEIAARKEDNKAPLTTSMTNTATASTTTTSTAAFKPSAESKVRDKVAALVANATTISENKIRAEIQKQRQEDMQVLANRFNKQKDIFAKEQAEKEVSATTAVKPVVQQSSKVQRTAMPPPPPPPPPLPTSQTNSPSCSKRRSPGDAINDDESKRARKLQATTSLTPATNRLYPALSDLESDNDNGGTATTASVSPINERRAIANAERRALVGPQSAPNDGVNDEYDEDNDSYMEDSEMMAEDGDGDDDDSSADICNGSLGRDIMKVVVEKNQGYNQHHKQQQQQQQQQQRQKKEVRYADKDFYFEGCGDSSINSSEGSMCVDDCIDEALDTDLNYTQSECDESDAGNSSLASRGSKGTSASNSFSFRKTPHKLSTYRTIAEEHGDDDDSTYHTPVNVNAPANNNGQPVTSNLTVNQNDENLVTLVHTVSFYRRQQNANSASNTPIRKICREQQVVRNALNDKTSESSSNSNNGGGCGFNAQFQHYESNDDCSLQHPPMDNDSNNAESRRTPDEEVDSDFSQHLVQEKIKKLLDEVCKQQQIIAQTSQALNLCAATVEFSGSTESVEGERHLLVATHRRQACLDEVQRLRVEKSLRPNGAPKERGRLTVKDITIPLRQDYIRKLAADTISGHHLVCLLKYNEHVLATKTVPTLPGLLAVKFPDVLQLNNVYADFKVTLEIYGMTAQREVLPHEVKYHINLSKKSGIKTPKKKGSENILVMPPVQSPAGPNVVRTPALVQYGFAIFSLRETQRTTWSLTQVLGVSPLEGVVHMRILCELSVSVEYKGFLTMYEDISGFGAWHRRWCNLNGTVINYWKYPDDERKKTPMGSIDLYSCVSPKIVMAPRDICARLHTILLECKRPALETDQESLIVIPNGEETIVRYLLSADTKEEREEWCAFFNKSLALLRAWGPPN